MALTENTNADNICNSIFKGGNDTTTKEAFTKKMIELINSLEKNSTEPSSFSWENEI